jgi:hypothetical protein
LNNSADLSIKWPLLGRGNPDPKVNVRGFWAYQHGIDLAKETVRQLQITTGLWIPRKHRLPKIQQPRLRRPCFPELIQIDGSEHSWFEDRALGCVLLVFIDDATGQLVGMQFCEAESTFEYMKITQRYLLDDPIRQSRLSDYARPGDQRDRRTARYRF